MTFSGRNDLFRLFELRRIVLSEWVNKGVFMKSYSFSRLTYSWNTEIIQFLFQLLNFALSNFNASFNKCLQLNVFQSLLFVIGSTFLFKDENLSKTKVIAYYPGHWIKIPCRGRTWERTLWNTSSRLIG